MIDYAQALNEAQLAAVTAPDGPVLVVAGAGSGKTRTIVYRLAWLAEHGVSPESILLLTFTRKAAREMLQRAGALLGQGLSGVQGGTFHAFAFGVLRRWRPAWLEGRPFTLMDQSDITAAVRQCKARLDLGKGDRSFPKSASIVAYLSKARNKELPLSEVLRREAFHLEPYAEQLEKLGEAYAAYKRENGLLDYDDLLFELEALLRDNAEAAAALRARFRHILVDEYQDTNLVQARIVRLLAGPVGGGEGAGTAPLCNVMAVGDEAQSIYAFRGANVRNILDFPKLFPGARILPLEENYRSTRPVLDVANSLLEHAAESFNKHLYTRKEGGEPVRLVTPLSDETQAALVTRRIAELLETYAPHEIAVLFRAGRHSFALEAALKRAGIAFRKYGGLRFAEFAHNKDVVAFARLALNPLDLPSFSRIAAMHKGVGVKTVERLYAALRTGDAAAQTRAFARYPELADDLRFVESLRESAPAPVDFFDQVIDRYRPRLESRYPDDWPQRQKDLEEILQIAANYTDLDLFVAEQALESPEEEAVDDGEGRITLSTIHSAKGLEWSAVLIIDLVEDRFPSRHALARPEDFEEERRLMYVACTRARKQLELYAPATIYSRSERGAIHAAQSPFVRELAPGLAEEWTEGFGGRLCRRPEAASRLRRPALAPPSGLSPADAGGDDCQLPPEEWPRPPVAGGGARASGAAHGPSAGEDEDAPANSPDGPLCHCRHRIFGRGKIVRRIPPDKAQVNFPGFGLKVILTDYLLMED
ncbi:MAG: ATP-dependent helicase [Desulfovibrio sp.]|nr:ATP-dependent helicase [Desulfovibrio sp.]